MEGLQSITIIGEADGSVCQSPDGNDPATLTVRVNDKRWDQGASRFVAYPVWLTVCMLPKTGQGLGRYIGPGVGVAIKARFIRNTWNFAGADVADQPAVLLADEIKILFTPTAR